MNSWLQMGDRQGADIGRLVRDALGVASFESRSVPGGRNNRGFEINAGGCRYFLKSYFHHPEDKRDRLGHDFGFCSYLWSRGVRLGPQPLWADRSNHVALFEFIDGRRLATDELNESHVDQALEFLRQANAERFCPEAQRLNNASEACFSFAEHVAAVDRRVQRLGQITPHDHLEQEALAMIDKDLLPLWKRCRSEALAWNEGGEAVLPTAERCLSPSDFGFHNALQEPNGRLRFLDFEYAGWDDPAKLVCDFANQPDVTPSASLAAHFLERLIPCLDVTDLTLARIERLLPLYQVKWACILLNIFLPGNPISIQTQTLVQEDKGKAARAVQLRKCGWMLDRARQTLAQRN